MSADISTSDRDDGARADVLVTTQPGVNPCEDRWHDLLRRYRDSGDRRARNQVVTECRPLAVNLARAYEHTSEPFDDRLQVAMVGLVKAANRFDPDYGSPFAAFASVTVRGELQRHFRDHGWSLRVPRRLQDLRYQIRHAVEVLGARLGHSPRPADIARYLGVPIDEVLDALCAEDNYRPRTIEATTNDRGPIDALADPTEPGFDAVDDGDGFDRLIAGCPPRLQHLLRLRFCDGLKQTEIAAHMGVSQVQISRLLRQALHLVRNQLPAGDDAVALTP